MISLFKLKNYENNINSFIYNISSTKIDWIHRLVLDLGNISNMDTICIITYNICCSCIKKIN